MSFVRQTQNYSLGVGANNISYQPDNSLPLYSYFGTGIIPGLWNNFHWMITQPPQFWVNPANRVSGLPGVVNGQFAMQPLIDTRKGVNGL